MKLNRGCGCLLLLLAFVNLVFVIAAIVGAAIGETSLGYALLGLFMFGANLVASLLLGIAAVRGMPITVSRPAAPEAAESAPSDEDEGFEEEPED